jgi:hypothetical protein
MVLEKMYSQGFVFFVAMAMSISKPWLSSKAYIAMALLYKAYIHSSIKPWLCKFTQSHGFRNFTKPWL